ncbi:MAG TPA: pitrilysin family protein, partial [Thermoanaerobaculia bacterium]|nr:pitrilysin family protein [Thermoanaerobaculia bacterium]
MSALRLRRSLFAAALAAPLLAAPAWTQESPQAPKESPPPAQPAREVRIPEVHEKTLPNGLRVVVLENHEQPSVSLRVVVPAGRVDDRPERAGLASATASLLNKGTATRSAREIAEAIDFVGGTLYAQASTDSSYAQTQLTSDQIDLGLELLADVVLRPSFPAEEVERWRKQTLNGLQVQLQSPEYLAQAVFERALFGEHPYGLPAIGTPQSVSALQRDDFVRFHQERYVPNGAIVTVAGDVKPAEAFAKVERHFGAWKKGAEPKRPAMSAGKAAPARRILVVDKPDAVQTQIYVGQLGVSYTDPGMFNAMVYSSVLGGGVSSRLYKEIRRDRGLSYGAYSGFQTPVQTGSFQATTSTKTESTMQALDLILENI